MDPDQEEAHPEDMQVKEESIANAAREYAVDLIMGHVRKGFDVKTFVHWYSYTPADDTVN